MLRICLLFVLLLAAPAQADIRGSARVIDGDTLEVAGTRVRLFGIDAPEMNQPCNGADGEWACGPWARDELVRLIGQRRVTCRGVEYDRYDRLVAVCDAGRGDLGAALVRGGAAEAYRRYSLDYVAVEQLAQADRRGIWRAGAQGMVRPGDFRANRQRAGSAPAQSGCAIKGNISSNGRIYHLPGQRDYDRTRIDLDQGERWFCTEDEARAAGWRRAQR
ncbi:MAG: thermonuclease family protein [Pararhodobacter sp.]